MRYGQMRLDQAARILVAPTLIIHAMMQHLVCVGVMSGVRAQSFRPKPHIQSHYQEPLRGTRFELGTLHK